MQIFKTEQEAFWAGEFGDEYIERGIEADWISANTALFSKILARTTQVNSVLELGANIGLNLHAIKLLRPNAKFSAVEINQKAIQRLQNLNWLSVYAGSILEFSPSTSHDFVLVKGVLIHLNPDILEQVYDLIHSASGHYICIAEYYNPLPLELNYRGHEGRLFKRDFAGEILDRFPDLKLLDYGFVYHRDANFPQDDITWFLMEK